MSIASDTQRIKSAKAAIQAAIEGKGVTVPDGTLLDGMASLIESIEAGGYLPTLPDGYALECGIYIPATDITSPTDIHLENTYIWSRKDRTGNTYCMISSLDNMSDVISIITGINFRTYNDKSGSRTYYNNGSTTLGQSGAINAAGFATISSSNCLRLTGTSAYPLKAGTRYLWIVVGEVLS